MQRWLKISSRGKLSGMAVFLVVSDDVDPPLTLSKSTAGPTASDELAPTGIIPGDEFNE